MRVKRKLKQKRRKMGLAANSRRSTVFGESKSHHDAGARGRQQDCKELGVRWALKTRSKKSRRGSGPKHPSLLSVNAWNIKRGEAKKKEHRTPVKI